MTSVQEHRERSKEMYRRLMQTIMTSWQSEHDLRTAEEFPGLDSMIAGDRRMEASVRLNLSELKWLESRMWLLRRIFLSQTDVLGRGETAAILVTVETILAKVLLAFAERYLDRANESKLNFLTSDEGIFDNE